MLNHIKNNHMSIHPYFPKSWNPAVATTRSKVVLRIMVDDPELASVDAVDIVLKYGLFIGAIFQVIAILSILVLPGKTSDQASVIISWCNALFSPKFLCSTHESVTHGTKGAHLHTWFAIGGSKHCYETRFSVVLAQNMQNAQDPRSRSFAFRHFGWVIMLVIDATRSTLNYNCY